MDTIIRYLTDTYHPRALLVYGSYLRGDADEYSDFDCMVIVDTKEKKHDCTVIDGVPLDCFIFTVEEAVTEDVEIFLPAYDARIVTDDGVGAALQRRVRKYVAEHSVMDEEEKRFIVSWFRKTLRRMRKEDDEGHYRAVAMLWESLCDYFILRDRFYFGSKQAVADLKELDPDGYELYHRAITEKSMESIAAWAEHVIDGIPGSSDP